VHRNLCTACKRKAASHFSAVDCFKDIEEDDTTAIVELNQLTSGSISREKDTRISLIVCIIRLTRDEWHCSNQNLNSEYVDDFVVRESIQIPQSSIDFNKVQKNCLVLNDLEGQRFQRFR
jgi:hypothetical protein